MTQGNAVIRAAAVAPILRWARENGLNSEPFLTAAHLDCFPVDDPLAVIPLRAAISLLTGLSRAAGPDTPYRIINGRGFYELGLLGSIALGGNTPREVLRRTAAAMPFHCSHEFVTARDGDRGQIVNYGVQLNLPDRESAHYLHQYCCALVQMICVLTGCDRPHFARVEMVAHPEHGFSHLRPYLMSKVSEGTVLKMVIPDQIADHALTERPDEGFPNMGLVQLESLKSGGTDTGAIAFLVESMMQREKPSIHRIASAVGTSRRSLQRGLSMEGTSFSAVVDEVRKRIACSALSRGDPPLSELAARLGYADQATLTRAVRRWTGRTPSAVAKGAN